MEIIHKEIHDKLNTFYEKNDTPNIIFHGSSGSGKKFIVYTFLNKIYDNDDKLRNKINFNQDNKININLNGNLNVNNK